MLNTNGKLEESNLVLIETQVQVLIKCIEEGLYTQEESIKCLKDIINKLEVEIKNTMMRKHLLLNLVNKII